MLTRKYFIIVLSRTINAFFSLISLYFISRYMGPTTLGVIGYASGVIGLFSSSLGFDTAHYKRVSEKRNLGTCIGSYILIKILLATFLITIIIGGILVWKHCLGREFQPHIETVLYIMLATNVILNLSHIFLATFGAKLETVKQQIPPLIGTIIRTPLIVIVAVASLSVYFLASTYLVAAIITIIFAAILFRNYPVKKPNREYLKSYTSFAFPAAIGEFTMMFTTRIDRVMIQHFFNFDSVGQYVAVFQLIYAFMILSRATGMLLLPPISKFHTENDYASIKKLVHRAERLLSMMFLPFLTVTIIFSKSIILIIFGEQFQLSANILILLSTMLFIAILTKPYGILIEGVNKPAIQGRINLSACTINIILNFILIPKELIGLKLFGLGAIGAALATLITWIIRWFLVHIYAYKLTKIKPYRNTLLHFIASILTGVIIVAIKQNISSNPITNIALALGGIGTYFIFLFLLKEFKTKDFFNLLSIIIPIKPSHYITKEIK